MDDQCADEVSEAEFLPRWLQSLMIGLGIMLRKFWLYVCAPCGLLFLTALAVVLSRS